MKKLVENETLFEKREIMKSRTRITTVIIILFRIKNVRELNF